ncbi:MAG: hypothetical protein ACR2OM_01510 [Aestuariivirgaceae bacterium]
MNETFRLRSIPLLHIGLTINEQNVRRRFQMFTRLAVTALTLTVLGAGAFAFAPGELITDKAASARVTEIQKNQAWPIKGRITMDPCAQIQCEEV